MAKHTILVCDDEEIVRASIKLVLEKDYQLVFATDGEDALKQFNAQAIDLVLLDLKMPKVDGLEVLKDLMTRKPAPRVLMLTAYHSVEVAQRATQLGGRAPQGQADPGHGQADPGGNHRLPAMGQHRSDPS